MEKIAIIGMGCIFPGANSISQFWQNLVVGRQTFPPATEAQLGVSAEAFSDNNKTKNASYNPRRL